MRPERNIFCLLVESRLYRHFSYSGTLIIFIALWYTESNCKVMYISTNPFIDFYSFLLLGFELFLYSSI